MDPNALIIPGIFIVMVTVMITAHWLAKKYPTKINANMIIFPFFALVFGGFFLFIKSLGSSEKNNIAQTISLKNVVVEIQFSNRKKYFKDMKLDNGQYLPMPEEMNEILQVGDSIYKNKGEDFYTIVNTTTKTRTNFKVKIHERVLGKHQ